ncbi:MAG: hypothetical protein IPO08_22650 [Xanthomonadales bacterium]|nr:hypothetical protein [Xanthomonadales bacterium]
MTIWLLLNILVNMVGNGAMATLGVDAEPIKFGLRDAVGKYLTVETAWKYGISQEEILKRTNQAPFVPDIPVSSMSAVPTEQP